MTNFDINNYIGGRWISDRAGEIPTNVIMPFFEHSSGRFFAYNIASNWFLGEMYPAVVYEKHESPKFNSPIYDPSELEGFKLGALRDWAELEKTASGKSLYVVVDHGMEVGDSLDDWPHGHTYIVRESGERFSFDTITSKKAFFHSVTTADVNGDGLSDIITSDMGSNFGASPDAIKIFLQGEDEQFSQDFSLAAMDIGPYGTGAVHVAETSSSDVRIFDAAYRGWPDTYGVRVFEGNTKAGFELTQSIEKDGLYETMGATRIREMDFNRDGIEDLVISLEGSLEPGDNGYNANGLEILRGDEGGGYTYITDDLLEKKIWTFKDLQFREFEIVDVDLDGWKDIVLHAWRGEELDQSYGKRDIGPAILMNDQGHGFQQLSGLTIDSGRSSDEYVQFTMSRFVGNDLVNGESEFFSFVEVGQRESFTVTTHMQALHRDADEQLSIRTNNEVIRGFAGDDVINWKGGSGSVDGGSGFDTLQMDAERDKVLLKIYSAADASISQHGMGTGLEFSSLERIEFADSTFHLDKFSGISSISGETLQSLIQLYIAYFDRAPDAIGLGYWATQVSNGMSLDKVAARFSESSEMDEKSVSISDESDFVSVIYNSVLGRAPDIEGLEYWSQQLAESRVKEETFVLRVLEGVPDGSLDDVYLQRKTDIGALYSVHKGLTDGADASLVMSVYDGTAASAAVAANRIEIMYAEASGPGTGEFLLQTIGILEEPSFA